MIATFCRALMVPLSEQIKILYLGKKRDTVQSRMIRSETKGERRCVAVSFALGKRRKQDRW